MRHTGYHALSTIFDGLFPKILFWFIKENSRVKYEIWMIWKIIYFQLLTQRIFSLMKIYWKENIIQSELNKLMNSVISFTSIYVICLYNASTRVKLNNEVRKFKYTIRPLE